MHNTFKCYMNMLMTKSNIGLSFAPDWFLMWHKFSTSIVEQSEAKPTEGSPDSFRQ